MVGVKKDGKGEHALGGGWGVVSAQAPSHEDERAITPISLEGFKVGKGNRSITHSLTLDGKESNSDVLDTLVDTVF